MARKHTYALTEAEFAELREKLKERPGAPRYKEDNIDAAYLAMVKGMPISAIAKDKSKSRQAMNRVVSDLWSIWIEGSDQLPEDWERVIVTVPHDKVAAVKQIETEAREAYRQSLQWVRVEVLVPPDVASQVQSLEAQARARQIKKKDAPN